MSPAPRVTPKPPDWGRFVPANTDPIHRLIWRSWGAWKSGKDHFALTGPTPYAKMQFDPGGLEGTITNIERLYGKRDLRIINYHFDKRDASQAQAQDIKGQFLEDLEVALRNARTISIDETELWEVYRFAEFGRQSGMQLLYGPLNAQYREMLAMAVDAGVNLQLIQKTKQKWVTNPDTGKRESTDEYIPTGFSDMGFLLQLDLEHSWTRERGFIQRVAVCRQNMALAGEEYENLTFPEMASLVFPETLPEDWK